MLASDPPVLLLDEPLAGMSPAGDPGNGPAHPAHRRPRRTIILVEHDIDVVMQIPDTITVFETGAILGAGTPQEIRANEAVRRAYLGDLA